MRAIKEEAMSVSSSISTNFNPSSHPSDFNNLGKSGYDDGRGGWQDLYNFAIGYGMEPQVLAVNGYADNSVNIGVQTAVPADTVSVAIDLGDVVNLNAFANAGGSGTVTSNASSQGLLTLTNGALSGTYTATATIDVTAYIAADQATVHMEITDSFQLSLSGTGFVGASLHETSASGGTVEAMTPSSGTSGPAGPTSGTFDLARFAASVLNTGSDNIAFSPEQLNFSQTERSSVAFSDNRSPPMGPPSGGHDYDGSSASLFHSS
ncbi:MAG: hypothetical protein ABSC06_11720 [Rhodopila sp.]